MTIFCIRRYLFWPFLICAHIVLAQDDFAFFWEPQLAVNYKVKNDYYHNFTLANRNVVYSNNDLDLTVRQVDIRHFSKLKVQDNQSISLGFMWRNSKWFDDFRLNEFRITQQYNITTSPTKFRYGHRFRTEQRLFSGLTVFRFRYRLALDFPLQGEKLDVGESYAILGAEALLSLASSIDPLYNLRIRSGMGWRYSPKSKIQFVLEYRLIDYTNITSHALLLETALNLGL